MKTSDAFPSKWLQAGDVEDGVDMTIREVTVEEVGQNKEKKIAVWFSGAEKGLICNKTNWKSLALLCDSDDSDNWEGHEVQLYETMVQFKGEETPAIRIRAAGSKRKPAQPVTKVAGNMQTIVGTIIDVQQKPAAGGKIRFGILFKVEDGEVQTGTFDTEVGTKADEFKAKGCEVTAQAMSNGSKLDVIDIVESEQLPF